MRSKNKGHGVRLLAIADFDLCEPILFKTNAKTKTVPANFIIKKDLSTYFIQPENLTQNILVSDNQIARLEHNIVKTEPAVEETISQSDPQLQNTDVGASAAEHQQPEPPEPSRTSTTKQKTTRQIRRSYTHKIAQKWKRMWWFQRNIKKFRRFLY